MIEFLALTGVTLAGALASAACYRLRPVGRRMDWLYFLVLSSIVTLSVGYAFVDQLTGQGLNAAARYHIWSGVRYAGWGQFRAPIAVAIAVLSGLWLGLGWMVLRARAVTCIRPGPWRIMSAAMLIVAVAALPVWRELVPSKAVAAPQFRHYYRTPLIARGDNRPAPNLVYLYLEGFERTYFDETLFPGLVQELRDLERGGTSFTNVRELYGTNWTMAGLVASQCGIPLLTPAGLFGGNSMSGMDAFLPGAIGLSDLLKSEGYHLAFLGGANVQFGGKDRFLRTHRFDEVMGASELASLVPEGTPRNVWGLYDDTLLDLAFEKFRSLSQTGHPFALFALTVDTHFPNGHLSPSMAHIRYGDGQNPMLNCVAASDKLVAQFVRRIMAEPAAENTVIVLASDHLAMPNSATPQLVKGSRRNLFFILNGRRSTDRTDLAGSTLDIAPTVLASLGFSAEVGLGRNLFEPVLQWERDQISSEGVLESWQPDILSLWRFPTIVEGFLINLETQTLRAGDREIRLPMLGEVAGGELRPKFEFDASSEAQTFKAYWESLPEGKPFLLIVPGRDLANIVSGAQDPGEEWCVAFGRRGQRLTTIGLPASRSFDRAWVRRAFADQ